MKQLKGARQRPKYRLSPNEVEQLKKEETERRRKLRIVQVREQSKVAAASIRQNVKLEKKKQLMKLAHEIEDELEKEKEEEVRRLEQQYDNTLRTIGQGHTQAILTDKKTCTADKRITAHKNREQAEKRHREALRKLALDKAYAEYEDTKHLRDRHAALVEEKKRAMEVAARPPPPPDPLTDALMSKSKQKRPVPLTDMNAFSTTHYHVPDFAVEKAPVEQQLDGKAAGEEEDQRTQEEISERRKKEHDQIVRARIRGNDALRREKLRHEYDALMDDLSLQQRADRRQRQLVVAKLPKQVFIPADRHMEELADKQMEMERAFEDMYMKQMNLSGDLSLTLDPQPLAQTPVDTSLEAANEDSPIVIPTMPAFNPALRELTNVSRSEGQTTQQGKPETAMKKLLNKIKEQRSELAEEGRQVLSGQENQDSKAVRKEGKEPEHDFTTARMPTSKPSADPQLDLSPLKAPGNQKPQRSQDLDQEEEEEEEQDPTTLTDGHEAGFLQKLQHRLHAIEVQKDHLDRMMRDRQQQQQQKQQQQQQQQLSQFPTYAPDVRTQPSVLPSRPAVFPATLSGPHAPPHVPASLYSTQPAVSLSGGPAGDVGVPVSSGLKKLDGRDVSALPSRESAMHSSLFQPSGTVGTQNTMPASVDRDGGQVIEGQSGLRSAQPAGQMLQGSGYPDSQKAHFRDFSGGVWRGLEEFQPRTSTVPPPSSSMHPVSAAMSAPSGSVTVVTPVPAGGGTLTAGSSNAPFTGAGFQAMSSLSSSSLMSQLYNRDAPSFMPSQPSAHLANAGPVQPGSASIASNTLPLNRGSLDSRGGREEERLRRLREYQQQLIVKHQERLKALQEVRTSIETRQAQAEGQAISTAPPRLTDPAVMVPYTLRTSIFPQESSTANSSSATTRPPTETARSMTSGLGHYPSSGTGEPGRLSGSESLAAKVTAPLSSMESARVLAAVEPILAGSSGMSVTQEMRPTFSGQGAPPYVLSDGGDRPTSASAAASKLDSVRKSLPFDNMDDTLPGGPAEGEAGLEADRASLADDSHLSSSTERGSPALGSRSNKSSTSGKSGSGLSAMSDGSLGGSSLVARAEEKRLSFEQRQRELQDQLAEIQRQKDALLQRYHGNQQRMSAQEESLRSKLKTAKAAASSSAPPSLAHYPVVSAVSLGVHQSASPSMELEERSLSSERLSTGRSWATELEEYSISQNKSGEGGMFKSPASMTLEEVSITSDRSGGRDVAKVTDRSAVDARPSSGLSSLEEYSIVSSRLSAEGEEPLFPSSLTVKGSHESLSSRRTGPELASHSRPDSGRGRLDMRDLMHELGSGRVGEESGERGGASATWSDLLSPAQPLQEENESSRLPPAPIRQPTTVADYEPHELSTILEVDTPQTANKTTAARASPPAPPPGGEGSEKPASRRCIDFGRHGAATTEEDRESKFSASGSSASSDVRSVIEVRTGILKSGEMALSTTGSGDDTSFEKRFRENILESSSMKGTVVPQGGSRMDPPPALSQEVSYTSSGQGFQSLELTLDSLTPRSVSVEDSQARRYLDFSSKEPEGEEERGGGRADEVLRQARQFNKDLMAAIQRQSADVFDQSSLSSISQAAAAADHSRTSQRSGQGQSQQ